MIGDCHIISGNGGGLVGAARSACIIIFSTRRSGNPVHSFTSFLSCMLFLDGREGSLCTLPKHAAIIGSPNACSGIEDNDTFEWRAPMKGTLPYFGHKRPKWWYFPQKCDLFQNAVLTDFNESEMTRRCGTQRSAAIPSTCLQCFETQPEGWCFLSRSAACHRHLSGASESPKRKW